MDLSQVDFEAAERSLRGVAVGDSLGLPYEGLSSRRGLRLMPFPLRQRLIGGYGFVSDDTVQSAIALASLARRPESPRAFQDEFGHRLRVWFLSIPPGIGFSTVKACLRLCIGVSPSRAGVFSAGNGAAMRAAVIGAALQALPEERIRFVEHGSMVTHTDPRAVEGAQLVALAAALAAQGRLTALEDEARALVPHWSWHERWPDDGPTGYVLHTVNAAIRIVTTSSGFEDAMRKVIEFGGDTDTVGAIVGGILGAAPSSGPVPPEWNRILGWPQTGDFVRIRAGAPTPYLRLVLANALALPIILFHGLRRTLPPYGGRLTCESRET